MHMSRKHGLLKVHPEEVPPEELGYAHASVRLRVLLWDYLGTGHHNRQNTLKSPVLPSFKMGMTVWWWVGWRGVKAVSLGVASGSWSDVACDVDEAENSSTPLSSII